MNHTLLVINCAYGLIFTKYLHVSTKFVSKDYLQVDPELESKLGSWFKFWKESNPQSLRNFDPEHQLMMESMEFGLPNYARPLRKQ